MTQKQDFLLEKWCQQSPNWCYGPPKPQCGRPWSPYRFWRIRFLWGDFIAPPSGVRKWLDAGLLPALAGTQNRTSAMGYLPVRPQDKIAPRLLFKIPGCHPAHTTQRWILHRGREKLIGQKPRTPILMVLTFRRNCRFSATWCQRWDFGHIYDHLPIFLDPRVLSLYPPPPAQGQWLLFQKKKGKTNAWLLEEWKWHTSHPPPPMGLVNQFVLGELISHWNAVAEIFQKQSLRSGFWQ